MKQTRLDLELRSKTSHSDPLFMPPTHHPKTYFTFPLNHRFMLYKEIKKNYDRFWLDAK